MKYTSTSFRKQEIFKLFGTMGIVVFGLFFITQLALADSVNCGEQVTSNISLTVSLDCISFVDDRPILQVVGPAELNLNGFTVIGNGDKTCIEVVGKGAKVWNGTVVNCGDGVVIGGEGRHVIWRITSKSNAGFGFRVLGDSDGNRLSENQAIGNMNDNFRVEQSSDDNRLTKNIAENGDERGYYIRGSNTVLLKNRANGNRDDALRLRNGTNNEVIDNILNGTESGEGVEIDGVGNLVRKNTFEHNETGVRIRDDGNVVSHNVIINNGREGIRVEGSANEISDNTINNNGFIKDEETEAFQDGLKVEKGATENIVTRNYLSRNLGNGIHIDQDATGNEIKGNTAVKNGVDANYFDALDGNLDPECEDNIWYYNIFGTKNPDCIQSKDCRWRRHKECYEDPRDLRLLDEH